MADLKAVYAAVDEPAALDALDTFAEHWDKKYPKILSRGEITGQISVLFKFLSTPTADLYDQHYRRLQPSAQEGNQVKIRVSDR